MDIVGICIISIVTSILSLAIKRHNSEMSILVAILGCIVILFAVFGSISSVFDKINELLAMSEINARYIAILFKAIGICFITEFSVDCCKDAGQNALANNVSIAGKLMVLVTAVPLFEDILGFTVSLIGG